MDTKLPMSPPTATGDAGTPRSPTRRDPGGLRRHRDALTAVSRGRIVAAPAAVAVDHTPTGRTPVADTAGTPGTRATNSEGQRIVDVNKVPATRFGDHIGWLVRRWWILIIAMAVSGVATIGYLQTAPPVYASVTPVNVLSPYGDGAKVDMDTEGNILMSATVAADARRRLHTSLTAPELLATVSYTVPANTSILNVVFSAATATDAENGSAAFAQAYLDQRTAGAQSALDAHIAAVRDQIAADEALLSHATTEVQAAAPKSAELVQAQSDVTLYTSEIQQLSARLAPLQAVEVDAGTVLSPASVPTATSGVALSVIVGAGTGLLIGLAIALALARRDTRVYDVADVAQHLSVPVLMAVRPGRSRPSVVDAATTVAREFSQLRNVLRHAADAGRGARQPTTGPLVVCGVGRGRTVDFVVANLAAASARSGDRVVIVCTDRESTIVDMLGVQTPYGLGEVLAGELTLDAALQTAPELPRLRILTAGQRDPRIELPVGRVADLLRELHRQVDQVLIATPPPSQSVDAQTFSEAAAAILVVVETRTVHRPEIDAALDGFHRTHAPVAGVVVVTGNRHDRKPNTRG